MISAPLRAATLVFLLLVGIPLLSTCSGSDQVLYVQALVNDAPTYAGQEITVDGAYVWRPGDPTISVLALGVSTSIVALMPNRSVKRFGLKAFRPK